MRWIRFCIICPCICCNCTPNQLRYYQLQAIFNLQIVPWLLKYSHTSLCGVALNPHGDRRGSHLIAAGNAHVVPRHSLQSRDFIMERRHCDIDEPGVRHLSFSPTHLFNLRPNREHVRINLDINQLCCFCRREAYPDVASS